VNHQSQRDFVHYGIEMFFDFADGKVLSDWNAEFQVCVTSILTRRCSLWYRFVYGFFRV
jgi:hypothetical protein